MYTEKITVYGAYIVSYTALPTRFFVIHFRTQAAAIPDKTP